MRSNGSRDGSPPGARRCSTSGSGAGRVVDGHGDLLADDIFCLDDGVRILDCLEFDDRLRWVDGLDDASFLAMDLERLGAPDLARRFTSWYAEYSGDPAPASLRHHYMAYRAFVRAKVACLRARCGDGQAGGGGLAAGRDDAGITCRPGRSRWCWSAGCRAPARPRWPGRWPIASGSPCSAATGSARNWPASRRSGAAPRRGAPGSTPPPGPSAPTTSCSAAPGGCSPAVNQSSRTRPSVSPVQRAAAAAAAAAAHADLVQLRCTAPAEVTARRLAARTGGVSDADAAVARQMAATQAPWPEAVTIDTGGPAPGDTQPGAPVGTAALQQALKAIRPAG